MKNLLLILWTSLLGQMAVGQTPELNFGITFGGSNNDQINTLLTSETHYYAAGKYASTPADFDPGLGQANSNANGYNDAFLAKYDLNGEHIWSFGVGSAVNTEFTDLNFGANSVVAVGYITENADLDPSANSNFVVSNGGKDALIVQYSLDGEYMWSTSFGGIGNDFISSMATDSQGNIYVCGTFSGTVDFDPDPLSELTITANYIDGFVAKYNFQGQVQWAFPLGGSSTDECFDIAVTSDARVAVTGYIYDSTDFDPGIGNETLTPVGLNDIFIATYNEDAAFQWAHVLGSENGQEFGKSVSMDAVGNVYLAGEYNGLTDFNPGISTFQKAPVSVQPDIFLVKFNDLGEFQWVNSIGGSGNDYVSDVQYNWQGSVYISGQYNSIDPVFNESDPNNTLPTAVNKNAYIAQYDLDGGYIFAGATVGNLESIYSSISLDPDGQLSLGGAIGGIQDIDPSDEAYMLSSSGVGMSACITSFVDNCNIEPIVYESNGYLEVDFTDGDTYTWWECDVTDGIVGIGSNYLPDATGLYAVEIQYGNCVAISNCYYFSWTEVESTSDQDLSIAPNPVSDLLLVSDIHLEDNGSLQMINSLGQIMWHSSSKAESQQIDVSAFAEGLYFLKIESKNETSLHKIIIQ